MPDIGRQGDARFGCREMIRNGTDPDGRRSHDGEMRAERPAQIVCGPIFDREARPSILQSVAELDRVEGRKEATGDRAAAGLSDQLEREPGQRDDMPEPVLRLVCWYRPSGLHG